METFNNLDCKNEEADSDYTNLLLTAPEKCKMEEKTTLMPDSICPFEERTMEENCCSESICNGNISSEHSEHSAGVANATRLCATKMSIPADLFDKNATFVNCLTNDILVTALNEAELPIRRDSLTRNEPSELEGLPELQKVIVDAVTTKVESLKDIAARKLESTCFTGDALINLVIPSSSGVVTSPESDIASSESLECMSQESVIQYTPLTVDDFVPEEMLVDLDSSAAKADRFQVKQDSESLSRDFPRLPLVDHLFTINIIDNIIGDAMEEIRRKRESNASALESGVLPPLSEIGDTSHRPSDISLSDISSVETEGFISEDSPLINPFPAPTYEPHRSDTEHLSCFPASHSDTLTETDEVSNDWTRCNGYLDNEEENNDGFQGQERELVTEIVFISETSFMDEVPEDEDEAKEDELQPLSMPLNPDAPVFVPYGATDDDSSSSYVRCDNESLPLLVGNKGAEECVSRYSDYDDRVDISDGDDDVPKSTPSSLSHFWGSIDDDSRKYLPSVSHEEDLLGTSRNDVKVDQDPVPRFEDEVSLELRSIPVDSPTGPVITDNQSQEKRNVDESDERLPKNFDNLLPDVISISNNIDYKDEMPLLVSANRSIDVELNKSQSGVALIEPKTIIGNSAAEIEVDDVAVLRDCDFAQAAQDIEEFEVDDFIGEKYMDHQQIYDPSKYKDYYQICSSVDVPDSPFDIAHQEKGKKGSDLDSGFATLSLPNPLGIAVAKKKKEDEERIPDNLRGRKAEIVLHETDDVSECGSEDVETIGHRYDMTDQPQHIYVNQLSLAAELLRTKQDLPYDNEFKPTVKEWEPPGSTTDTVATVHGTVVAPMSNAQHVYSHYYGNPCFEMEDLPSRRQKEVSDSGVQSEESTDEGEDIVRNSQSGKELLQAGDNSPQRANFGYKKFGTTSKSMSAVLKGKSDPLCLCCEIM